MTTYTQPLLSIDVVPVYLAADGTPHVILGRRIYEPFLGEFALPGVLLNSDERTIEAASRALREKVLTPADCIKDLEDVGAFDSSNRDPRGASVSVTYLATIQATPEYMAAIEATDRLTSVPLAEIRTLDLPFDHNLIIEKAVETFTEKFLHSTKFTKGFLGDSFTSKQVRSTMLALEAATGEPIYQLELQNLTRKLKTDPKLVQAEETAKTGKGRPSSVWTWV